MEARYTQWSHSIIVCQVYENVMSNVNPRNTEFVVRLQAENECIENLHILYDLIVCDPFPLLHGKCLSNHGELIIIIFFFFIIFFLAINVHYLRHLNPEYILWIWFPLIHVFLTHKKYLTWCSVLRFSLLLSRIFFFPTLTLFQKWWPSTCNISPPEDSNDVLWSRGALQHVPEQDGLQ